MTKKNICKIIDNHKKYILAELKTGRHIDAILGSIGFNFADDCQIALKYIHDLNIL